jgi:hypothetical protein
MSTINNFFVRSACVIFVFAPVVSCGESRVSIHLAQGKELGAIVALPAPTPPKELLEQEKTTFLPWSSEFEVRTTPSQPDRLLLRVFMPSGIEPRIYYDPHVLALDTRKRPIPVSAATLADWDNATKPPFDVLFMPNGPDDNDGFRQTPAPRSFILLGQQYRPGGARLAAVLPSPDKSRVVVLSWNGDMNAGVYYPDTFDYFLEAFETATGRLVFAATGHVSGAAPNNVLADSSYWPSARFFVFPLSASRDKLLLIDFDRRGKN